ncbi:MAG TPA: enoyl-CoA hydratase/isomerase family protein [Flavobacteriia bacterium]|jgi:methylglutaconyl-CoA hydratase|nr:enoyl-CoA hydratase/isomerase family protein [Flavobacteriia bacterium]
MNTGEILTSVQNKVATIRFSHPAGNSFPSVLLERLIANIKRFDKEKNVTVIILKSDGDKAFCAGASFDELVAIQNLEQGKQFFIGFANLLNTMRKSNKIIVGRVQGKAVGGGVGIISACDYVFATENASIKLSELSIGIGPFVIEPAVERKIGVSALSELSLDPTHWKTAYWAEKKGLYHKVFDTVLDMDKSVEEFTQKLANYNPEALLEMKKVLWKNTDNWNELLEKRALISGKLVLSDFTKNALQKFKK